METEANPTIINQNSQNEKPSKRTELFDVAFWLFSDGEDDPQPTGPNDEATIAVLTRQEMDRIKPLLKNFLVIAAQIQRGIRVDETGLTSIADFANVPVWLVKRCLAELSLPLAEIGYIRSCRFHAMEVIVRGAR